MAVGYLKREGKLLVHQVFLFGILLLLTGWRLWNGTWEFGFQLAWWWLGAVVGFVFVFFDRLVYVFWQNPEAMLSLRLRELWAKGKLALGLATLLQERQAQERLIIRSFLFLVVWVVMAVFTFFSVGNLFGRGFMSGLGLHLGLDLFKDYLGEGRDVSHWFWQIKRQMEPQEITVIVWGFGIVAVLLLLGL